MHSDERILKIHVAADGRVWQADGIQTPSVTQHTVGSYVASLIARPGLRVRMLGTATNAEMLVRLYNQYARDMVIEVATPDICENADELSDPTIVLYRMRQCLRPASLGGWHQFTKHDYASYLLASDPSNPAVTMRAMDQHACLHDLCFVKTISLSNAAAVLGAIIDPKWFIDLQHPARLSRLRMYLGLTPWHMQQAVANQAKCARAKRCLSVLRAWGGDKPRPTAVEMFHPGNFLWRRADAAGGGVKGLLRASATFITYCVRTWEQQRLRTAGSNVELFMPEALFRDEEVAAYKRHDKSR